MVSQRVRHDLATKRPPPHTHQGRETSKTQVRKRVIKNKPSPRNVQGKTVPWVRAEGGMAAGG